MYTIKIIKMMTVSAFAETKFHKRQDLFYLPRRHSYKTIRRKRAGEWRGKREGCRSKPPHITVMTEQAVLLWMGPQGQCPYFVPAASQTMTSHVCWEVNVQKSPK